MSYMFSASLIWITWHHPQLEYQAKKDQISLHKHQECRYFVAPPSVYETQTVDKNATLIVVTTFFIRQQINMGYMI